MEKESFYGDVATEFETFAENLNQLGEINEMIEKAHSELDALLAVRAELLTRDQFAGLPVRHG